MASIIIDRIQLFAMSATPSHGPESSLGSMPVRNGLLLRLTSSDGVEGWGEAWCNFPPRGNLSRLFLFEDVIAPRLIGRSFSDFSIARPALEAELARIALHTGESGPFANCFAAVDTALADIAARQAGLPLCQFLSADAVPNVAVYASTPDVSDLEQSVDDMLARGHQAAKLKVGFDRATDIALLARFHDLAKGRLAMMVDANQNWTLKEAKTAIQEFGAFDLQFIEEPIAANAPQTDWAELAAASDIPIAAGENITSLKSFTEFIRLGGLRMVQPDVAKWGGVSGGYAVGREARECNATCAMHYMGTAVGLAASIQVLAAIGGTGPVELDANPNPLRTDLGEINLKIDNGHLSVPKGNGIGFVPDPDALRDMTIKSVEIS